MIYVGENKALLCKGDFHPAELYKGSTRIAGYSKEAFEGEQGITLENCYNDKLHSAQIIGNCVQEDTPSPETPMEIKSVGDLVTEGEHSGKYKIGVTARGKNLFDSDLWLPYFDKLEDGSYKSNRNISRSHRASVSLPPGEYTISLDIKCPIGKDYSVILYDSPGNTIMNWFVRADEDEWRHIKKSFTLSEDASSMSWFYSAQTNELYFKNFQIEKGAIETGFEPYKMPRTFDLYLDEPLCKMGSYEDFIDFENKKVIRNTNKKSFTGTETWRREDYRLYIQIGNKTGLSSDEKLCLCNRFEPYSWYVLYRNSYLTTRKIGVALQGGSYLCVTPAQEVPTVADWKAQLSAWNDEGTPLTVVYADATREEEIELPALPTFRGTTVYEISTETPSELSGKYKKEEE